MKKVLNSFNKNQKNNFPDDYNLCDLTRVNFDNFCMKITKRFISHYKDNDYEKFSSDLFLNLVTEDSTVVDVGANYGYYSLLASTKNKKGETIAFEPVKENFDVLNKNVKENAFDHIKTYNYAISDKKGKMEFNVTEASDSAGFYEHPNTGTKEKRVVKTISLDEFFENKKIDVIKIDVEGHESYVLDGMKKIINSNENIKLLIEFNPKCLNIAGTDPNDLIKKLAAEDLDIFLIKENARKLFKLNANRFEWKNYLETKEYCNLLCVKKNRSFYISIISHSSNLGGAERSLLDLIDGLLQRGILCHVIIPDIGPLEKEIRKRAVAYDVLAYRWWIKNKNKDINVFERWIKRESIKMSSILYNVNPCVIYTNTSVINGGAIAARILNIPHIWHVREFGEKDHGLNFILNEKDRYEYIAQNSEFVIFNSQAVRNNFLQHAMPKMYDVIYNNVYVSKDKKVSVEKCFSPTSLKILILGGITENKGQMDAVRAVHSLVMDGKNVELIIVGSVGSNTYVEEINKFILENRMENVIRVMPFTNNPGNVIAQSDIVLSCSKSEAFGRTIIEAMLMKKVVIATKGGGIPEIIHDGENGLLYESGNHDELAMKIDMVSKNVKKMKILGNNGFRYAHENFSDEKYAGKISQIIATLSKSILYDLDKNGLGLLYEHINHLEKKCDKLKNENEMNKKFIDSMYSSKFWLMREKYMLFKNKIKYIDSIFGKRK